VIEKPEPTGKIERIVFFGTPEFAVPSLIALCAAGVRPLLVVSQPARPVGRGRRIQDPPVAAWAREQGLEVVQPERPRSRSVRESIAALAPDLGVVVAYGEILTRQLLAAPRLGFVNVHASLLPKYRGAAPIQAAIAAGDTVSGVTTMQVEPGLDSGPALLMREVAIGGRETSAELAPRLAQAGAELLVETIEGLERGAIEPRPQNHAEASYSPRLTRADARVDWSLPAEAIHNRLRAFTPWPGVVAEFAGEEIKLLAVDPVERSGDEVPGTVLGTAGESVVVRCGQGTALSVLSAQRPGRRPVTGAELARSTT